MRIINKIWDFLEDIWRHFKLFFFGHFEEIFGFFGRFRRLDDILRTFMILVDIWGLLKDISSFFWTFGDIFLAFSDIRGDSMTFWGHFINIVGHFRTFQHYLRTFEIFLDIWKHLETVIEFFYSKLIFESVLVIKKSQIKPSHFYFRNKKGD